MCRECGLDDELDDEPTAPRPVNRRPRVNPGVHTQYTRKTVRCGLDQKEVRWSRLGPRCDGCWHIIEGEVAAFLRTALRQQFLSDLGFKNHLIADDWDDSVEGSLDLAKALEVRHPYLRLRPLGRRKSLFKIATLQHAIIALETADGIRWEERARLGQEYQTKINTLTDELLGAALK